MRNEVALALMLLTCGGGVLLGRALPREPSRDAGAAPRPAPSLTFTPSRQPTCGADRAELEKTQAELARCVASTFRASPASPGSPHAMPKIETGPDGLIRVDGEIADPAMQKMFGGQR